MNRVSFVSLVLFIFVFTACSSLYMPNVPNTPMLSAPGELHASGNISLKGNTSLNTAYALSDNLGVMVNGAFVNRDKTKKDFRQNLLEAGAGYFTTFGLENNRILEIYAGAGRGSTDYTHRETVSDGSVKSDRQEISFNKSFLQVNYSSKKAKTLRLFGSSFPLNYGTALRASYINMRSFRRNDIIQPKEDNIFLEPIFFTRMRLSEIIQLQYTTGSNFGLKHREFLKAGTSGISLGFVMNVGRLRK